MADERDTARAAQGNAAEPLQRTSPAARTFLLSFVAIALVGLAVVGAGLIGGRQSDSQQVDTISRVIAVVAITAFVLGIVAARRGLRAWLAGYVGAVLGGVLVTVAHDLLNTTYSFVDIVLTSTISTLLLFALLLGVPFLIAGGLTLAARRVGG